MDLWPLYAFVEDAITINLAIDIQTSCRLNKRQDAKITLRSRDIDLNTQFDNLNQLLESQDKKLSFLKPIIHFVKPSTGFDMEIASDSPIGGGLGGSSSLTVSILKAFQQTDYISDFDSTVQFANIASNIEANILQTPTGTQDYVPAIQGGLSLIHYDFLGMRVESLPIPEEFVDRMTLVYTGRSHHSGINNFEVLQRAVNKDSQVLKALFDLREVSIEMSKLLKSEGSLDQIEELLPLELKARLCLAESFTSPEIQTLQKAVEQIKDARIKICGAGGGGCVLVWSRSQDKAQVSQMCESLGFKVLPFNPIAQIKQS